MTSLGVFAAFFIALLIIRLAYAKACLKNVDVKLSISAATATEGDELYLTEVITNEKWLPLPWLAVKFQVDRELEFADTSAAAVSDMYYRNDLFHILMYQKITRRLKFTCSRRGYYAIRGLEITGWDVLMERKYIKHFECNTRLTVYPGSLDIAETDEICTRVHGHLRAKYPIYQDPFSFGGIRDYSPSDPLRSVNFKASARSADLMVNIREHENARRVVLLLDIERHIAWYNEALEERAVKIIASLAERLTSRGVPLAFITNGISIVTGSPTRMEEGRGAFHMHAILEALAHVDISAANVLPFDGVIDEMTRERNIEPEYWLISAYFDKNVSVALRCLTESGARAVWLMPSPKPSEEDTDAEILYV